MHASRSFPPLGARIVAIDAARGLVVKNIPTTNLTFPNSCPNNPANGRWSASTASADHTLFVNVIYNETIGAVFVLNVQQQAVVATIVLTSRPVHNYYIPYLQQIWSHSDSEGTFDVIDAKPPYEVISNTVLDGSEKIPGHGGLLFDIGKPTHHILPTHTSTEPNIGYVTNVNQPGVYEVNLLEDATGQANNRVSFLNFTAVGSVNNKTIVCPGTHDLRYSQVAGRVFVVCTSDDEGGDESGPQPGLVEFNPDNNEITDFWQIRADHVYVTPDQSYLLAVAPDRNIIHTLHFTAGNSFNYTAITVNGTPSSVAFYPITTASGASSYMAYISLANGPGMAAVDLLKIFSCGANCPTSELNSYITIIKMGQQNPLGASGYNFVGDALYSNVSGSRPLSGGVVAICTTAAYENAVYCYNHNTQEIKKYDIEGPQLISFQPGVFNGTEPEPGSVSTTFSCDSLSVVPSPGSPSTSPPPSAATYSAPATAIHLVTALLSAIAAGLLA
eukprot:SM000050S16990  [mRNA]  locus=s50:189650:192751:- [translate_table: standard]